MSEAEESAIEEETEAEESVDGVNEPPPPKKKTKHEAMVSDDFEHARLNVVVGALLLI